MRHKPVHVHCPNPSTFAGPWIPPPGRTTRGTRYGWQVNIGFDLPKLCNIVKYYVFCLKN